ncbi:hypothetical protein C8A05DRAFT_17025 [Staphylotrichum tortipilum]|uniref:Uncharacterized protein n=1 Tax=Staphylotrichum tortipilum TaxID=2831512 RepID=A0AAN6MHB0_9PEZI|nr:hypothetical protein C8A05DRAFT_17025 [Staphylotrichum longicolle]
MEVQLELIGQGLEPFGPWRLGDVRFQQQDHRAELEAALLQTTATIPGLSDRLLEISKATRAAECQSPARPEVTLSVTKVCRPVTLHSIPSPSGASTDSTTTTTTTTTTKQARPLFRAPIDPLLSFTRPAPATKAVLSFPLRPPPPPPPRPCLKRRRPDTDVDGPNTAVLGCKKRRLLRHLITSRLSQPFSLPATHILNRESVATGDRRFLKLAAIMSARRLHSAAAAPGGQPAPPPQPSASTWLRRAAVLNSLRSRVCAERGSAPPFQNPSASSSSPQPQSLPQYIPSPAAPSTPLPRTLHGPAQTPGPPPHPRPTGLLTPSPSIPSPASNSCPQTRLRIPSPTLRPLRSPELRVTRLPFLLEDIDTLDEDEGEDGVMAFPTSEHESRYLEDEEDGEGEGGVYADFSVIFGGGGGDGEEEEEGEWVEDYMDELDGIPWGARC